MGLSSTLVAAVLGISTLDFSVAFVIPQPHYQHNAQRSSSRSQISATTSDTVNQLMRVVDSSADSSPADQDSTKNKVTELLDTLEASDPEAKDNDPDRFEPLIGMYDVSFVAKARDGDNPVGGKWTRKTGLAQKILNTRRTFQHLLPTNTTGLCNPSLDGNVVAEAVNVVSLDALWGLIRLTIILRGDAVPLETTERQNNTIPLTSRVVRAFFDPPRVVFGKMGRLCNLYLGPTSSVVLDSTYVDERVRIGKGGTSGTRFVFARCPDNDEEAMEYKSLLQRKPTKKVKVISLLGAMAAASLYRAVNCPSFRVVGSIIAGITSLLGIGLALSTGGIERDDVSYRKGLSNASV